MTASILRALSAAAVLFCASPAFAQAPSSGIDLGNLTPKTPSQKAAADAAAATTPGVKSGGVPGTTVGAAATSSTPAPGTAAKGTLSKSGIGVVGLPGSGAGKAAPAATEDTAASSTDVQVKMPSSFKK